eukprot:TRINITY_DN2930_c0_g2_i1.p1 TRINITY_DN2930_c0_g2~~TRINITY_DN2930_c0_g2_i1.p1  ORF type:complete len:723 (+),score=287.00 TRINITY_DN2930_c0_g2_i1:82-2250(+)
MQCVLFNTLFLLLVPGIIADHPVKSVIDLLKGLQAKVAEEGRAEQVTYNKFELWCKKSTQTLEESIEAERVTASRTSNAISGSKAEASELQKMMDALDREMAKHDNSIKELDDQRKEAKDLYDQAQADFDGTITALQDSIAGLKASAADADATSNAGAGVAALMQHPLLLEKLTDEQEAMLLEISAQKPVSKEDKKTLMNKKQYEFKSGKVVQLLTEMMLDFQEKMKGSKEAELKAVQEHKFTVQDLKKAKDAADGSKSEKAAIKGEVDIKTADLEGTLKTASNNKAADEQTLKETTANCVRKESEWNARKEARYGEEKAIIAAVEILAKVAGVRTEVPKSSALLEQSASSEPDSKDARAMVVNMLRRQAQSAHFDSAELELLASQIQTSNDEKTGKELVMSINKQKWKLEQEQLMEDKKKQWCDKEFDATNKSIHEKTDEVEKLNATLLAKEAKVAELSEDITKAKARIDELDAATTEATEIRREDKAENKAAIRDSKEAVTAITEAIGVLSKFYASAAENAGNTLQASLIQRKSKGVELPDSPDTWGASYSGVADPNNQPAGVVAILEKTLEDFSKMLADTQAQEEEDQTAYEKQLGDMAVERARLVTESELKSEEKTRHEIDVQQFSKTMMFTDRELAAAKNYIEELGVSCTGFEKTTTKYEDRKRARDEEIKQLLTIIGVIKKAFGLSFLQKKAFLAPVKPVQPHFLKAWVHPWMKRA